MSKSYMDSVKEDKPADHICEGIARGIVRTFNSIIPGLQVIRVAGAALAFLFVGSCVSNCSMTDAGRTCVNVVHSVWSHAADKNWTPEKTDAP